VHNKKVENTKYICWRNLLNNTIITLVSESFNFEDGDLPQFNREVLVSYIAIIPGNNMMHTTNCTQILSKIVLWVVSFHEAKVLWH